MATFFYVLKTRVQTHLQLTTNTTKSKCAAFGVFFFGTGSFNRETSCFCQTVCFFFLVLEIKRQKARERKRGRERKTDKQKASSCVSSSVYESLPLCLGKRKKKRKNVRGPPARAAQVGVGLVGLLRKAPPMITVV